MILQDNIYILTGHIFIFVLIGYLMTFKLGCSTFGKWIFLLMSSGPAILYGAYLIWAVLYIPHDSENRDPFVFLQ